MTPSTATSRSTNTDTSTATPRRIPLDTDRILDAAVALIEAEGATAFSMRRLAATLDVTPMALYKWFDNREALLDALSARVFDALTIPEIVDGPWEDRMLAHAIALREGFDRSRAIVPIVSDHRQMDLLAARMADRILALLAEIGCTGPDAVERFRAFFWTVVGFAFSIDANPSSLSERVHEQLSVAVETIGAENVPTLAATLPSFVAAEGDALFEFTMRLLIDSIARSEQRH